MLRKNQSYFWRSGKRKRRRLSDEILGDRKQKALAERGLSRESGKKETQFKFQITFKRTWRETNKVAHGRSFAPGNEKCCFQFCGNLQTRNAIGLPWTLTGWLSCQIAYPHMIGSKVLSLNYHKVNRDKKAKTGKSLFVAFLANFGEFILSGYLTNLTQIWPVVSNTPQLQHRISELLFYFSLSRTASLDVRNTDPNSDSLWLRLFGPCTRFLHSILW